MAKRRVKKKNVFVAILIFILIIGVVVAGYLFITSDKKEVKEGNKEEVVEKEQKPKEKRMSLVAVGDTLIHAALYLDASRGNNTYDFSYMFTDVEPIIKDYDLKYYNQETIIGGKNLGVSHYPRFNSPDEIGENLVNIGFNLVSLANNHTMDKDEAGILYSVDFWKKQEGVVVSGQSNSFEDRNDIKYMNKME